MIQTIINELMSWTWGWFWIGGIISIAIIHLQEQKWIPEND